MFRELESRYRSTLLAFMRADTDKALEEAVDVGQRAAISELGILELTAIHHKALTDILSGTPRTMDTAQAIDRSVRFFSQVLSPFESTLRNSRELNEQLMERLTDLTHAVNELKRENEHLAAEADQVELRVRRRLAHEEERAADRLALLAHASTLLSSSVDSEATLRNIAALTVPSIADCCFIYLVESDGSARRVAFFASDLKEDAAFRALPDPLPSCVATWIERMAPSLPSMVFAEINPEMLRTLAANDTHFEALRHLQAGAAILAPLVAKGHTLGVLGLFSTQPGLTFSDSDRIVVEDLARRCSYVVDSARLYKEVTLERDRAEEASRIKDEFLAILSHELRNPLVPILGWARVLRTRSNTTDDVLTEGIRSLERNAHNIQRLVDDCLELVRTSTRQIRLSLERLDINSIVAESIEAIMPLARTKGLKLDVQLSPLPLWVVGDSTRLEQVFVNLLSNAVKYTPEGAVEIRSTVCAGQAVVKVKDSGIGIAPDFIEKVFEPFRQATSAWLTSDSGLGIGLSIAREIVRLHSGTISASSEGLNHGSTFSVALPLTLAAVEPITDVRPQESMDGRVNGRLKLLLVEDSTDVLFLIKQELEWAGYEVLTASDGASALEMARREIPDVIISDIKMPQIDGYEFIRRVRQIPALAGIPAIAMTGFGMGRDVEAARDAGYMAHLIKPINIDQMRHLIEKLTSRSPSLAGRRPRMWS